MSGFCFVLFVESVWLLRKYGGMIGKWSWLRLFWRFCSLLFSSVFWAAKGRVVESGFVFLLNPYWMWFGSCMCSESQIDCFWWWVLFLFRKSRLNEIFLDFFFVSVIFLWYPSSQIDGWLCLVLNLYWIWL